MFTHIYNVDNKHNIHTYKYLYIWCCFWRSVQRQKATFSAQVLYEAGAGPGSERVRSQRFSPDIP